MVPTAGDFTSLRTSFPPSTQSLTNVWTSGRKRTVLATTAIATSSGEPPLGPRAAVARGVAYPASQPPMPASTAAASARVTTRRLVAFNGASTR